MLYRKHVGQRLAGSALTMILVVSGIASLGSTKLIAASVTWLNPASDSRVSGSMTLKVSAPDTTDSVTFWVDNTKLGRDSEGPSWRFGLDTTSLSDGPHTLTATARRRNGEVLGSATMSVTVANGTVGSTATELTTGLRLGSGFNPRWFYVKNSRGAWVPTYASADSAAHGKLMNFRASRALFPNETDEVIANLDAYRAHGILMLTTALQTSDGWAFSPNGTLDPSWMERASRLIEAADQRGMFITLHIFFQGEDQEMTGDDAIRATVRNVADWVRTKNYRNVIIEIANEYNHRGFDYDLISTDAGIASLVELAQSRFAGMDWRALVTASRGGCACWPEGRLRQVADVAMIHGNSTSVADKLERTPALVADKTVRGPVVMNEDDNLERMLQGPFDQAALQRDKETASGVFAAGASWGMMVAPWNQVSPYDWQLGGNPGINGAGEELERNYVHAVLDHVQRLVGMP